MPVIELDFAHPLLAHFYELQHRRPTSTFVVEGEIPVRRFLTSLYPAQSLICTPSHYARLQSIIPEHLPVMIAESSDLREKIVGFNFHRGCVASGERSILSENLCETHLQNLLCQSHSTIVVAMGLSDPCNLGAVIRNSRAFAADLVIVSRHGADPLSCQAIRSSVGNVFHVPLVYSDDIESIIHILKTHYAYKIIATSLGFHAQPITNYQRSAHIAILVGNEGVGLDKAMLQMADDELTIPICAEADSINVAAATAVVLFALQPAK